MKRTLLRNIFADDDSSENRNKFIQNRIHIVEKHIPQLNSALKDYTKKTAGVRDYGDKVALALDNYAKAETITASMAEHLRDFANILLDIGSRRDLQIKDVETKVLEELVEHVKLCKHVHSELKSSIIANDKEKIRHRQLRRIQDSSPQDRQQISLAEAELFKARGEASRSSKSLEEQIDLFERKKLNSIKNALLAWTMAELHFHAKALQLFTEAYRVADRIDIESDVESFRNQLRTTETTPRLDTVRETSFRQSDSVAKLVSLPFHRRSAVLNGTGIPHPSPSRTSSLSSVSRSTVS